MSRYYYSAKLDMLRWKLFSETRTYANEENFSESYGNSAIERRTCIVILHVGECAAAHAFLELFRGSIYTNRYS